MTRRNRNTLKHYFLNGSAPTQAQFEDLVDSTLNIIDEGFDKSTVDGLKISQLGESGRLISFYKENLAGKPLFFVRLDGDDNLVIATDKSRNILFMADSPTNATAVRVGINTNNPENELDVFGVIRSTGRIGVAGKLNDKELEVPADGNWHDITDNLYGCQAYEITAGAGGQITQGHYALMHAIAMNTFNPKGFLFNFLNLKKSIKYQSAHYRSKNDRLRLRWQDKGDEHYTLQLKSGTNFGDGFHVKYYLTKLWFDEDMSGSRPVTNADGIDSDFES
ncbi:MAG: hypothetical protein IH872_06070 [Chloroflexi bacterium]|nr:hypothetical protein [Chloroflexota bacterium]